jgi:hypothetical protein
LYKIIYITFYCFVFYGFTYQAAKLITDTKNSMEKSKLGRTVDIRGEGLNQSKSEAYALTEQASIAQVMNVCIRLEVCWF